MCVCMCVCVLNTPRMIDKRRLSEKKRVFEELCIKSSMLVIVYERE